MPSRYQDNPLMHNKVMTETQDRSWLLRSSSSAQMTRVLVMSLRIFRGHASSMLGFRPTLVCTNQYYSFPPITAHPATTLIVWTNQRRGEYCVCHLYRDLHG